MLIWETMAFVDWDSDLYLQGIITTITPLPDIHCNRYDYMRACTCIYKNLAVRREIAKCLWARRNIHTLLIISRVQIQMEITNRTAAQLLLLLSFFPTISVGVAGNVQYFVCCRRCRCCRLLALCKCENLQLDLGLQGPKWIFIIYRKNTTASKWASEHTFA